MSMIYGNAALALLGCFMCVFMVLTFIALLVKAHRAVAAINIPIAIATQGESIRVSLSCRLKEAGFDGVKYRVTVKNNFHSEIPLPETAYLSAHFALLQKYFNIEKIFLK